MWAEPWLNHEGVHTCMWAGKWVLCLLQDLFKQTKLTLTLTLTWGNCEDSTKGSVETVFDNPKRSKVNKAFSYSSKLSRLKFNSWNCVLPKSNLVNLLDDKKKCVDLWPFGVIKTGYPLFPLGPSCYCCRDYNWDSWVLCIALCASQNVAQQLNCL